MLIRRTLHSHLTVQLEGEELAEECSFLYSLEESRLQAECEEVSS